MFLRAFNCSFWVVSLQSYFHLMVCFTGKVVCPRHHKNKITLIGVWMCMCNIYIYTVYICVYMNLSVTCVNLSVHMCVCIKQCVFVSVWACFPSTAQWDESPQGRVWEGCAVSPSLAFLTKPGNYCPSVVDCALAGASKMQVLNSLNFFPVFVLKALCCWY